MSIFFTADTHFDSVPTLLNSRRPFSSILEMNNYLISNWCNLVSDNDIIYMLGDLGNLKIINDLPGYKIIILGNHERRSETFSSELRNLSRYKIVGNIYNIYCKDLEIELVHEPSFASGKFFTLFGHVHQLCKVKKGRKFPKGALNVGVDCHNFFPVSEDTVLEFFLDIKNVFDDEIFIQ